MGNSHTTLPSAEEQNKQEKGSNMSFEHPSESCNAGTRIDLVECDKERMPLSINAKEIVRNMKK